jgi:hypothetical protein
MKMKHLERITYILLITVCVASLAVLVKHGLLSTAAGAGPGLDTQAHSLMGKNEPSLVATAWTGHQRNVVLLLSSQCHFCEESLPLYQELSSLRQQAGNNFSLLAVGLETPETLGKYLTRSKVTVDNVLQAPQGFAGVHFTPAVFVVDSHGVIQNAFLGKLDGDHEKRLLDSLKN